MATRHIRAPPMAVSGIFMHALHWTGLDTLTPVAFIACPPSYCTLLVHGVSKRQIVDGLRAPRTKTRHCQVSWLPREPTRVPDSLNLLLSIQANLRPAMSYQLSMHGSLQHTKTWPLRRRI